ncbi:MAG: hypothetical protein AAGA06_06335 [Pseudomonadota bacterium]
MLSPRMRSRVAFTALIFSVYLVAADRMLMRGDVEVIAYLLAPVIAVLGVGHADGRETFARGILSVLAMLIAGGVISLANGQFPRDYQSVAAISTALTGLFTLNLTLLAASSTVLRRLWPTSNHWTR